MVSQWNSSGISSQEFTTLQPCSKVQELLSRFHSTDYLYVDVHRHLMGDLKTLKKNANQVLNSFLSVRRDLEQDNGHSSDLDHKRNGILLMNTIHKENGDRVAEQMMLTFAESKHQSSDPRIII